MNLNYLKKLAAACVAAGCFMACSGEAEKTKEKIASTTSENKTTLSNEAEIFLGKAIVSFKDCKASAEKRMDCRNSITKMVSEFYTIDDFKNDKGNFVIYDSIQPIVKRSSDWKRLGSALDQEVLSKAQENANNGKATIAIDTSETYGLVVMVVPGETRKSNAWSLNTPNAAALVNYNPEMSFFNKALSYAFKSPKNVVLFSKE